MIINNGNNMYNIVHVRWRFIFVQKSLYETEIVMSYSVLRNGGTCRHWRFVLRNAIQQEVRVKRKQFKRFRDN